MPKEKKISFHHSSFLSVIITALISTLIASLLMFIITILVQKEYIDISIISKAVLIIHFISVYLANLITQKAFGNNLLTSIAIVPGTYSLIFATVSIAFLEGIHFKTILIPLIAIIAGWLSYLTIHSLSNRTNKTRKRKRSW